MNMVCCSNQGDNGRFIRPPDYVGGTAGTRHLLFVNRLPAMLLEEEAAVLLGLASHDLRLIRDELPPLGAPTRNSVKRFAAKEVLALAQNVPALHRVRNKICSHWQHMNSDRGRSR